MKRILFSVLTLGLLFSACSKDDDASTATIALSSSAVSSDSLTISWDKVDGALFYTVEIALKGEEAEEGEVVEAENFTFSNLLANTEYDVLVYAAKNLTDEKPVGEGALTVKTTAVNADLVGVWNYASTVVLKYSFKEDGSGVYTYASNSTAFTWKTIGSNLIITKVVYGLTQTEVLPFTITDTDLLTLTEDGGNMHYFKED